MFACPAGHHADHAIVELGLQIGAEVDLQKLLGGEEARVGEGEETCHDPQYTLSGKFDQEVQPFGASARTSNDTAASPNCVGRRRAKWAGASPRRAAQVSRTNAIK